MFEIRPAADGEADSVAGARTRHLQEVILQEEVTLCGVRPFCWMGARTGGHGAPRTASEQMTLRMTTRRAQDLKGSAGQSLLCRCFGSSSRPLLGVDPKGAAPLRDNVDMIQPSHYSAAPSGNLCTTSNQLSFVVQGESRRSVRITGEIPQLFRPERVARRAAVLGAPSMTPSSALSSRVMPPLAMECSPSALGFAAWTVGQGAVARVTREQLKHGRLDDVRGRLHGGAPVAHASDPAREQHVVEHARHDLRDSFTRNSFFT